MKASLLQRQLFKLAQTCNFTRSLRKIVLTKDVDNLGFKGEICFVKPGFAFNSLVPKREALFFTDPKALKFVGSIDVSAVKRFLCLTFIFWQLGERTRGQAADAKPIDFLGQAKRYETHFLKRSLGNQQKCCPRAC